jgi:ankyrin repeat protein
LALLKDAKVLIDSTNLADVMPLHWAVIKWDQNAVEFLLKMGARDIAMHGYGRTPLDFAIRKLALANEKLALPEGKLASAERKLASDMQKISKYCKSFIGSD